LLTNHVEQPILGCSRIPVPPRIELVVGEMAWKGAGIPSVTD